MTQKAGFLLNPDMEDIVTYGKAVDEYAGGDNMFMRDPVTNAWVKNPDYKAPTVKHWNGAASTQNNTTASTKSTVAVCYHTGDFAFASKTGIEFYGATGREADIYAADVIFDLGKSGQHSVSAVSADRRVSRVVVGGPIELNAFLLTPPEFVDIEWPDFSIPYSAGRKFWDAVLKYIEDKQFNRVMASCTGGNGRTGTFLSIMYGLTEGVNGADAVDYIRKHYCTHAVETPLQREYVIDMVSGRY